MRKIRAIGWWLVWSITSCSGVGQPIGGDEQPSATGGFWSTSGPPGDVWACLKPRPDHRGNVGGNGNNVLMGRCKTCGLAPDSEQCEEVVHALPTTAFPEAYVRCWNESVAFAECVNGNLPASCGERFPTDCAPQCAALAACW